MLSALGAFVEDMNSTNSTIAKSEILKKYECDEDVKKVLLYTYDPYRKYRVTPANLEKNWDILTDHGGNTLFELLDDLNSGKYTGNAAIGRMNSYLADNFLFAKYVNLILDRNLKIRMDVSEINKVFPGLIPTFDVALAKTYEKSMSAANARGKKKVDFERDVWMGSRKLDGARCVCVIDENRDVKFFSRKGHEFNTLENLAKEIRQWGLSNVVFDGEICLMLPDGREDFRGIMKQIRKKDHSIASPKYNMFDMLTLGEFRSGKGETILSERLNKLSAVVKDKQACTGIRSMVGVLTQGRIKSAEHLDALTELAGKNGWEGLIIRRDMPYSGKRTPDMLKVKDMQDAEYVVTAVERDDITSTFYRDMSSGCDVEYDDGSWVRVGDGKEIDDELVESYSDTRIMVSKLVVIHKGNPVGVGSGLSMAQRREWHDDDSKIIGKTITVQYFHETEVDGRLSLRFPVLKWKYDGERDV